MADLRGRVRLPLLVGGLVAIATVGTGRAGRARGAGGRGRPPWATPVLDAVVPLQKAIALPVDFVRHAWNGYAGLVDVGVENARLEARIHELEQENLELREALVAG